VVVVRALRLRPESASAKATVTKRLFDGKAQLLRYWITVSKRSQTAALASGRRGVNLGRAEQVADETKRGAKCKFLLDEPKLIAQ